MSIIESNLNDPSLHRHWIVGKSAKYSFVLQPSKEHLLSQWKGSITRTLARTFLPAGYPHSVRKEYMAYQFWDSLQGLCSYLRSVLTTQSILIGAGVGSVDKTAMAAALVWIVKDGVGMVASLIFAYFFSGH